MWSRHAKAASVAASLLIAAAGSGVAAPGPGDTDTELPFPPGILRRAPDPGIPGVRPIVPPEPPSLVHPSRPGTALDEDADGPPAVGRGLGEPAPPKPKTRAEVLDGLFARLAKAADADEAQGIVGRIQEIWMASGSPTADLLMVRVVTAAGENRRDAAEALLDKIIALEPGWAEAWNKRATLRVLDGDDRGSMEDISHVLALEPRHFGALAGMAAILERHGEDGAALVALRRALALNPENPDLRKAVDRLVPDVEGRDL